MQWLGLTVFTILTAVVNAQSNSSSCNVTTQYLADPPYNNFFYSDCNVDAQVVSWIPNLLLSLCLVSSRDNEC